MSVLKLFNNFMTVFFYFGLAPFRSGTVHIKLKSKAYLFPVVISSIINVSIAGFSLYFNHSQSFGPINSILTVASLSTGMILNLAANLQCYVHPSLYQNLLYRTNKIESRFREHFTEKLSLSFVNRYKRKVLLIFSFAIISGLLATYVLWNFLNIDGIPIAVLQTIITCYSAVVIIHAILYVDIAHTYIELLNLNIKHSPVCFYSARKIEFMKNIKLMHMDIWNLVMQINRFFSWSLLSFTINFMINLVYDLYKIFRVIQSGWSPIWASGNIKKILHVFALRDKCSCNNIN